MSTCDDVSHHQGLVARDQPPALRIAASARKQFVVYCAKCNPRLTYVDGDLGMTDMTFLLYTPQATQPTFSNLQQYLAEPSTNISQLAAQVALVEEAQKLVNLVNAKDAELHQVKVVVRNSGVAKSTD